MHIQVDHSWQIEKTNKETVLVFTNTTSRAVLISAATKQHSLRYLTARYEQLRRPYLRLYAACLYLLLKPHLKTIESITIDADFPGYEGELKGMILNYIRRERSRFSKRDITFASIGKKAPAHLKALSVFRGQKPADHEIKIRELEQVL